MFAGALFRGLGFLWPNLGEGFGAVIDLGPAEDILAEIRENMAPSGESPAVP